MKIKYLWFILLLNSCSDQKNQIIINEIVNLPNQNYSMDLRSNSGQEVGYVIIEWNAIEGEIELNNLSNNEIIIPSNNSHTFQDMQPEDYFDIELSITNDTINYIDTIQIFSRSVYPVTNFKYEIIEKMRGDGLYNNGEEFTDLNENSEWDEGEVFVDQKEKQFHRELSWSPTKESSIIFNQYNIFRSSLPIDLLNPENCNCKISDDLLMTDSTYIDSSIDVISESGNAAFYYMVQVVINDYHRNSYIYGFNGFNQFNSLEFSVNNISSNRNNYISIEWDSISDNTYFYQYELYRSKDNGVLNIELIADIPNSLVNHFQDRNAGSGTTWYYAIAIVDVAGRKSFSNYFSGWVLP